MSKGALIIGGSVAGIQAALDLADSGIDVDLVESLPFLGSQGAFELPSYLFNTRMLEVAKHPRITVWTNTQIEGVQRQAGRFEVDLVQHPRYVDLTRCTACGDCVEACPVTVPGTDRRAIVLPQHAQPGCAAIEKVGMAPCSHACPGGIHVQGYVALVAQGRFQEAIDLIREAIPFPGICGRICTHPCEVNCRRAEVDGPVAIRLLKRFVSDWELEHNDDGPFAADSAALEQPDAKRVAIVGAGPGGMAAANTLARQGHQVTVFEKLPVIGGMMAVGIPQYRLPRDVIAREYQQFRFLGVEIRLNTEIGPSGDHTLDDLFDQGFDAICLAIGAHKSRELRIPGEDLEGVVHGIDLLRAINLSQQVDEPHYGARVSDIVRRGANTRVAVLGGGNTAMDVARSLRRLGVEDVRVLYRRTRNEMPAQPEEVEDAEQEGVTLEYLTSPLRVLGNEIGQVVGLQCQRMELGEPDASGRRRPVPIADSEFVVDLDVVVLAIGQSPDLACLQAGEDIALTRSDRIQLAEGGFATSRPGVFAAGDAVTTDKMAVIEAIGMGKKAATQIDAYLRGHPAPQLFADKDRAVARREMSDQELTPKPRVVVPTLSLEQRIRTYNEVELGYSAQQAIDEAQRCLVCGPCSECMACERVCEPGAIVHTQGETRAILQPGAIIVASEPVMWASLGELGEQSIHRADPEQAITGSAAAARAMFDLFALRQPVWPQLESYVEQPGIRMGVFVCQCGGHISDTIDTALICEQAATWPAVVHTQELAVSCSKDAASTIQEAIAEHGLNRVVLAACSCCSLDQVCYSCTYQRIRCKENLGVLGAANLPPDLYEFVNIREQVAWAHDDDPQGATTKALALIAAAAAKSRTARLARCDVLALQPLERSALILGQGPAASRCLSALGSQGIAAQQIMDLPMHVGRVQNKYTVVHNGTTWQASALVLAPQDDAEGELLRDAFGAEGQRPSPLQRDPVGTHRSGVFACTPDRDPELAATAAASRVAAWLGRAGQSAGILTAVVDAARCRACNTCVEVCEYGAPQLVGQEPERTSWIDPILCTGCGTCAAHCPSAAITAGYSTDAQLEAMLDAALA